MLLSEESLQSDELMLLLLSEESLLSLKELLVDITM
jgi:hypothetical protein